MGRQCIVEVIKREIMDEISDSRCFQQNSNKTSPKNNEMDVVSSAVISAINPTLSSSSSLSPSATQLLSLKGQAEESIIRRMDQADDLQLLCTKKCIPCHRCGSSMKFFMRRVKYLNTVKEYPAYRCMKKKCQTFRSPRTLARECNMLLRQGFGDGRFMNVAPTTNATRQLKEAFPDHFNKQETDVLQGSTSSTSRNDFDAFSNNPALITNSATSNVIREKEAWYALRNAKQLLDVLIHTDGELSSRLHRIINEIHELGKEISKKNESVNAAVALEYNNESSGTDEIHEMDDEGYDSMRRSAATDLMSLTVGGDSRSSFDAEIKSETSSVDSYSLMKMPSSTSALSPNTTSMQPLRWINISRHSPSFNVKMVDGAVSAIRQTVDQAKHTMTDQQSTINYESILDCINNNTNSPNEATIIPQNNATPMSSLSSLPSIVYDQPSTSYDYGTTTNITAYPVTESNSQLVVNDNNDGILKTEPIPIYVRPSELCFDDIADGGEILNEFFMPSSTSNFQPAKLSTMTNDTTLNTSVMSTAPNTVPIITFSQLWNFNEQYDPKETSTLPSQATSATVSIDLMPLALVGDSRSSFDSEIKSEINSVDPCILMKMPSSTSALSPNTTHNTAFTLD